MGNGSLSPAQRRTGAVLAQAWFPPHPDVLARVRSGIASGELLRDRAALLRELMADPSLFLLGVRELTKRLTGSASAEQLEPSALVSASSERDISEIFGAAPESFCCVPYHVGGEHPQRRAAQAMVSAVTTGMLAAVQGHKEDLSYSCALFRQLGLMLIAWNHPHLYARISAALEADETLDEALARVLGISPSLLGLSLAREWRVCPIIRAAMGDDVPEESEEVREVAEKIRGLCEVGERIAQIAEGQARESRLQEYEEACTFVLQALGANGLNDIFSRVEKICKNVRTVFPAFSTPGTPLETGAMKGPKDNPHLAAVPRFLQEHLQFVYERFAKGAAPEELRSVLDQAVRSLGFTRAIIYLLDPVQAVLHPRLALGDQDLASVRGVPVANVSSASSIGGTAETVSRAFSTDDLVLNGRALRQLAVRIGSPHPIGVLSLEIAREMYDSRSELLGECARAIALTVSHLARVG